MRSGDGLLVRVRPRVGAFSVSSLYAISAIAARFGSGDIDLTNRANLQIRGVSDESYEGVLGALDAAGLLDFSAEIEAVRNVVVDPLSGLDPERSDVRGLAAALEEKFVHDRRLWTLPGKFGFSISGSAEPRIAGRSTDIMISAGEGHTLIALDGAPGLACEVARVDAVDAAHHLALAFLEVMASDDSVRRMRDAVFRLGAITLFAMAGMGTPRRSSENRDESPPIGFVRRDNSVLGVGIGFPFGRGTARQLDALCEAAAKANSETVHMSPERALVFPVTNERSGTSILRCAEEAALITRRDDIRLAMDVCPGLPACRNASTDTRRDAQSFADTFNGSLAGRSLHISGCEKGCARRESASLTLVGRGGRYELIKDGRADSSLVRETIGADDVAAAISRVFTEPTV
jgi:precorrin-3B synthase